MGKKGGEGDLDSSLQTKAMTSDESHLKATSQYTKDEPHVACNGAHLWFDSDCNLTHRIFYCMQF